MSDDIERATAMAGASVGPDSSLERRDLLTRPTRRLLPFFPFTCTAPSLIQVAILLTAVCIQALFLGLYGSVPLANGFVEPIPAMASTTFVSLLFTTAPTLAMFAAYMIIAETFNMGADDMDATRRRHDGANRPTTLEILIWVLMVIHLVAATFIQRLRKYDFQLTFGFGLFDVFIPILVSMCNFRVTLVMRSLLLGFDGADCRDRTYAMLSHIKIALATQFFFIVMMTFNLSGLPTVQPVITARMLDGTRNCSHNASSYHEYHHCICADITPEYLQSECTLSADVALGPLHTARLGFAPYTCKQHPDWLPYRNALCACRAYTAYPIHGFLASSTQLVVWGIVLLWTLAEYDALSMAEDRRLGRLRDIKSQIAAMVSRSSAALTTLLLILYASVQFTSQFWFSDHEEYIGIVNGDTLPRHLVFATALLASLTATVDTVRQIASTFRRQDRQSYDCFLTHDWGSDSLGRDNHQRVSQINRDLKSLGFVTWFDEERLTGDINKQMADGIDHSKMVVVFITKRYLEKVAGAGPRGDDDNCRYEFNYACNRKGVASMLAVVMEPECRDTNTWQGTVGGKLGSNLYVDAAGAGAPLSDAVQRIATELRARGVMPLTERSSGSSKGQLVGSAISAWDSALSGLGFQNRNSSFVASG